MERDYLYWYRRLCCCCRLRLTWWPLEVDITLNKCSEGLFRLALGNTSHPRQIFKTVWRKRLQQSSRNETWVKNPFWQPAKVVSSWKVRRACPPASIQIQLLCKYTIPSSLTLLFLSDQLSYSVPLFFGSLIVFNSPEGKWFDSTYILLKDK